MDVVVLLPCLQYDVRLRAGYPIYEVQRQLGHASPQLTLTVYGRFIPSAADVEDYQERYKADAEKRRSATGGAA